MEYAYKNNEDYKLLQCHTLSVPNLSTGLGVLGEHQITANKVFDNQVITLLNKHEYYIESINFSDINELK